MQTIRIDDLNLESLETLEKQIKTEKEIKIREKTRYETPEGKYLREIKNLPHIFAGYTFILCMVNICIFISHLTYSWFYNAHDVSRCGNLNMGYIALFACFFGHVYLYYRVYDCKNAIEEIIKAQNEKKTK